MDYRANISYFFARSSRHTGGENMTKVFVLTARDEFELVKKMNQAQLEKDIFATQPMQKQDGSWLCFIYYREKIGVKKDGRP